MTDDELRQLVESNARSIQMLADTVSSIAEENRRPNEELRQTIQALGQENQQAEEQLRRGIQAFADQVTTLNQQAYEERVELRQAMIGIANLVSSLDGNRPTVLRKLISIETKVDRLLDQSEEEANDR